MINVIDSAGDCTQDLAEIGQVSDGYHTFDELYRFRMLYNAALFNEWAISDAWYEQRGGSAQHYFNVHKSKRHWEGDECFGGGWFIVMAMLPGQKQISNHYPMEDWDLFQVPVQDRADKWDGHTPEDVADRLEEYVKHGIE